MEPSLIPYKRLSWAWQTAIGLIGKQRITTGIMFTATLGIHTWFMRVPIDVVLLQDNRITAAYPNVQPWRIVWWGFFRCTVVELPTGTIERYGIRVGATAVCSQNGLSLP